MKNKIFILAICTVLVISLFPLNTVVHASSINHSTAPKNFDIGYFQFEEVELDATEENLTLAIEIAKSTIEENTILNEKSEYAHPFNDHIEAGLSQEAFDLYNQTLVFLNNIEELPKPEKLTDIIIETPQSNPGLITPQMTRTPKWYGVVYGLSNSETNKVIKVLNYGAGVAGVAAALGGGQAAVAAAAAIVLLSASTALCNWNDRGINIHVANIRLPHPPYNQAIWCTPK